jgi:hypothetical protein
MGGTQINGDSDGSRGSHLSYRCQSDKKLNQWTGCFVTEVPDFE